MEEERRGAVYLGRGSFSMNPARLATPAPARIEAMDTERLRADGGARAISARAANRVALPAVQKTPPLGSADLGTQEKGALPMAVVPTVAVPAASIPAGPTAPPAEVPHRQRDNQAPVLVPADSKASRERPERRARPATNANPTPSSNANASPSRLNRRRDVEGALTVSRSAFVGFGLTTFACGILAAMGIDRLRGPSAPAAMVPAALEMRSVPTAPPTPPPPAPERLPQPALLQGGAAAPVPSDNPPAPVIAPPGSPTDDRAEAAFAREPLEEVVRDEPARSAPESAAHPKKPAGPSKAVGSPRTAASRSIRAANAKPARH